MDSYAAEDMRNYRSQYSQIYFCRLMQLMDSLTQASRDAWNNNSIVVWSFG